MSVEHMPDERLVRYYENVRTKIRYDFAYCARAEPGAQSRRSSSARSDHPQSCQYDIPTSPL